LTPPCIFTMTIPPIDLPPILQRYTYTTYAFLIYFLVTVWRRLFQRPPPPPPPPPHSRSQRSPSPPPPPPPPPHHHRPIRPLHLFLVTCTLLLDSICVHTYPVLSSGAIVITGASSGIGRAACVSLAKDFKQYQIYAGVRSDKDAESIRNERITNLIPIHLDVTNPQQIQAAVETIVDSQQPLVALVNNAGVAIHDAPIELVDLKRWRFLYDVNVFGLVQTTQHFLPLLRLHQGRVINIGSIAGDISQPMWSPYASSKHAVEAITDSLRVEMRQFGISVSLIKPGEIKTNLYNAMQGNKEHHGGTDTDEWNIEQAYANSMKRCRPTTTTETRELYSEGLKQSLEFIHHCAITTDNGEVPSVVMTNHAITHAITSPTPRTRYVFGGGAAVWPANLILPDKITDVLHHWLFNLDGWKVFHQQWGKPLFKILNAVFYW
jgi:NAD(P)-dependent dehydrogenase (short-subunit alcohol dehydrogenase family)